MNFHQIEEANGLRFSFNVLPTNRVDASSCCFPLGCLYTPLKPIPEHQPVQYEPIECKLCKSFLNPYCAINFNNKSWKCPICQQINILPPSYHEMTQDFLCAELLPEYTTIEYILKFPPTYPPVFFFVIDTCVSPKELASIKSILLQVMEYVPKSSLVGFITFGTIIYLHELRFSETPQNYIFNGSKTYSSDQITQYFSMKMQKGKIQNDIIIPKQEAEQMLTSFIDNISYDSFPVEKGKRPQRCTGAALHLAVTLIHTLFGNKVSSHIFLFSGGPITKGPGKMAEIDKIHPIRQHHDIEQGKAPLSQQSREFFSHLAIKSAKNNIVINYISASFEESGIYELFPCVYQTGGFILSNETFSDDNIYKTFMKYFKGGIIKNSGVNSLMTIRLSSQLKVCGCIGPCKSCEIASSSVSNTVIGCGGTTQWQTSCILPNITYAFYFDIFNTKIDPIPHDSIAYIQFQTRYRHTSTGATRLRVTTTALRFADLKCNKQMIMNGFDQEAAAVLLSKQAMYTVLKKDEMIDIIHIIDQQLIGLCKLFGNYTQNEPGSFELTSQFSFIPQFIYHLRRSPFLNKFNSSLDQIAFYRHALLFENVANSMCMIQPMLIRYSLDQPPTPVLLDTSSLKSDCTLLLDSYFLLLIWHGATIAQWRDMGYQEQEEYQNLKAALEQPKLETLALMKERFPTPQFVICDQDSSLSRYLLARCNQSGQGTHQPYMSNEALSTDEQSLSSFIKKLKVMVTSV